MGIYINAGLFTAAFRTGFVQTAYHFARFATSATVLAEQQKI
jgi:hypothetical protein